MRSLLALFLIVTLTAPAVAYAEDATVTTTPTETVTTTISPTSSDTTTPTTTVTTPAVARNHGHEVSSEMHALNLERKTLLTQHLSDMKAERQNFEDELKTRREDFEASVSAERAAFKAKLKMIKDQRKQILATNIDAKLSDINKNRTDQMAKALDQMNGFITKLQDKITVAKSSGKDTSAADAALAAAQKAITDAQTAVTAQAAKTYTATITDDSTLGQKFGSEFTTLMNDLKTTYVSLHTAKDALITAVREVAKLNVTTEPSSSESAQ